MILAIDLTNYVHSIWYAQKGRGVLNTVVARVTALVDRLKPAHVVACCDRPSFRHEIFTGYKANRKPKPEGLLKDLAEAPEAVADVATLCQQDGFEADDGLATLSAIAFARGEKCVLASPDKDVFQCLLSGYVTVLRNFTTFEGRVEKCEWYTTDTLREETGLSPAQWPEYQALCGDSTDHIPGCAGWGEVTSLEAMQRAGSLAEIFRNPWAVKITPKQQASLLKFKGQAELMLKLTRLRTVVDKLPRTADGVSVVLGMDVWCLEGNGLIRLVRVETIRHISQLNALHPYWVGDEYGHSLSASLSQCYSTHEAAEAAKETT